MDVDLQLASLVDRRVQEGQEALAKRSVEDEMSGWSVRNKLDE